MEKKGRTIILRSTRKFCKNSDTEKKLLFIYFFRKRERQHEFARQTPRRFSKASKSHNNPVDNFSRLYSSLARSSAHLSLLRPRSYTERKENNPSRAGERKKCQESACIELPYLCGEEAVTSLGNFREIARDSSRGVCVCKRVYKAGRTARCQWVGISRDPRRARDRTAAVAAMAYLFLSLSSGRAKEVASNARAVCVYCIHI